MSKSYSLKHRQRLSESISEEDQEEVDFHDKMLESVAEMTNPESEDESDSLISYDAHYLRAKELMNNHPNSFKWLLALVSFYFGSFNYVWLIKFEIMKDVINLEPHHSQFYYSLLMAPIFLKLFLGVVIDNSNTKPTQYLIYNILQLSGFIALIVIDFTK